MNLTSLAMQITGNGTDDAKPVSVTPSAATAVEIIEKTAKAVADAGIPDDLNRWKDMTPAKLAENEKAREKMRKQNGKIGPKERKLAADRAKKSNEPGAVGGLTEKDKAAIAALKKEAAQAAKEKIEKRIAALKAANAEKKAVKAAAKAAKAETAKPSNAKLAKAAKDSGAFEMPSKPKASTPSVGRSDGLKHGSKMAKLIDAALDAGKEGITEAALCKKLGGWKKCAVTLRRVAERVGATVVRNDDGRFVVTKAA